MKKKGVINGDLVRQKWISLHGKGQLREMFDSCDNYFVDCDNNQDYQLSFEEADTFLEDFCRASSYTKEDLFQLFDGDGDGQLSASEFRTAYLTYDMLLLDEIPIKEFIRTRQKSPYEPPIAGRVGKSRIPNKKVSDPWIGKEVEVRWLYNTVRNLHRWENGKVEERNPDGTYQVLFEGDAYTENIKESDLRPRCRGSYRVVILGRPGAGKRTQSANFCDAFDVVYLSCDQLLKKAATVKSRIGLAVKAKLLVDEPIPDAVIIKVIQERVSQTDCLDKGFILEGFPQTSFQARALDEMLGAHAITHVFNLRVPTSILKERIVGRRVHEKTRRSYHLQYNPPQTPGKDDVTKEPLVKLDSDTVSKLEERIDHYKAESKALLQYYRAKLILRDIDGSANEPQTVWEEIQESLNREPDEKKPTDIDLDEKFIQKPLTPETDDEPFPPLAPLAPFNEKPEEEACVCVIQ